jgi:hypothetical protein
MTTVAREEFKHSKRKEMLKKLSTTWSIRLRRKGMSKSKLYNLIEAVNMALHALKTGQRIVELKLRLLRYITHIKMELQNGQLVLFVEWQRL